LNVASSSGDQYTVRSNTVGWGNLLAEFITGEGPTHSMFLGDHPMTEQMKDAYRVNTGRDAFYKNLANNKDRLTNWNGAFGLAGIARAGDDMTEQYVGSFRLDVILSKSGNSAVFIVTQSTNMKSAGYRMLDAYPRGENPTPGGNMYQKFVWIEPLD
jgi:hypothetical protein